MLPLSSWHYWTGDRVQIARDHGADVCSILSDAGWPHTVPCVLCGTEITRAVDWWDLDGVSGPMCSHMSDCRSLTNYQAALGLNHEQAYPGRPEVCRKQGLDDA